MLSAHFDLLGEAWGVLPFTWGQAGGTIRNHSAVYRRSLETTRLMGDSCLLCALLNAQRPRAGTQPMLDKGW